MRKVVALEHVAEWATRVSDQCSAEVLLAGSDTADAYLKPALDTGPYDLIIVDGIFRNECLSAAARLAAPNGVIVLDDAQRKEYRPGIAELRALGFRMIELHGPQPVSKHPGCTTIFYRRDNVLDL